MTDHELATRHGTDPGWTHKEIARAETQDAANLPRPPEQVSRETMERMGRPLPGAGFAYGVLLALGAWAGILGIAWRVM